MLTLVAAGIGIAIASLRVGAADWPQWRGPDRSNRSAETGLLKSWPTNGPPLLWKITGLGDGIASVSVADGRIHTTGYRDGGEFVYALNATSGEKIWATRIGRTVNESALMRWLTQRSPTLDDDRLYILSADGDLFCLRTANGQSLWQKSFPRDFNASRRSWGFSDRPLVDGDKLICLPGGTNATVVALTKRTGEIIWKTGVPGDERAGYAGTVVAEAGGVRHYVASLTRGLAGIAASDGRVLWRYQKSVDRFGGTCTPIVTGDFLFSANGYGAGMALLKLVREGDGIVAQEQYYQSFNFDAFQDNTALAGDYIYSYQAGSQRGAAGPVCIEMKTGKLIWGPAEATIKGRLALTYADGHLYLRGTDGSIILAEATPKEYVERSSFRIPEPTAASGATFPVIAGGRLYVRDNDKLLAYDISADALDKPRAEPKTLNVVLTTQETLPGEVASALTGKSRGPDAIFVPTPHDIVDKMLELASVKTGEVVYDLGSGDGRIVIAAGEKYGCKAVGYEIDERLVRESRESVQRNQVGPLVRIEHEDLFKVDLSGADVVAVFLPPPLLDRLRPQFEKLKPGARIVSHQFAIPGIKPDKTLTTESREDGEKHAVHLWTTPLSKAP